ncbi:hypothetical protein NDU88_003863 [Pleurodeles waltl]|uniref:Uncharacterized protein n=1 Tax=Pleurodeles waltl TaxID=8319 RepID=A0AAV7RHT6_PLEWA|nr:hypothetical protein NDU88_003863 [Pleurodeles waltl]
MESCLPTSAHQAHATQSEEGKLLALRTAALLTEAEVSNREGARSDQDQDTVAKPSDSDSQTGIPEDFPRVMPQISKDII